MVLHIVRSINQPIRQIMNYEERIESSDLGVINAWEVGRELALKNPSLAEQAKRGELPELGLKGGIAGNPKIKQKKYGCLWYLAQWQGLRSDDLDIYLDREVELVCTRTNIKVIFTPDMNKYING